MARQKCRHAAPALGAAQPAPSPRTPLVGSRAGHEPGKGAHPAEYPAAVANRPRRIRTPEPPHRTVISTTDQTDTAQLLKLARIPANRHTEINEAGIPIYRHRIGFRICRQG